MEDDEGVAGRGGQAVAAVTGLALGLLVGVTFGLAGLTVPAPGTLSGVLGVVGLWAGGLLAVWVRSWL